MFDEGEQNQFDDMQVELGPAITFVKEYCGAQVDRVAVCSLGDQLPFSVAATELGWWSATIGNFT